MKNGLVKLHGEGGEKIINSQHETRIEEIRKIVSEYSLEEIFNLDEFGLLFKFLPSNTYVIKEEKKKTLRGNLKSKKRISVITCVNATGQFVPQAIISTAAQPFCLRKKEQVIKYYGQKNSWVTRDIFNNFNQIIHFSISREIIL